MIENLKKEIASLEQLLNLKKEELAKLIDDEKFKNKDQLIVVIEMCDQFSGITEVFLINNKEDIKKTIDSYKGSMYGYEIHIYKNKNLKDSYKYLMENLNNSDYCQDNIYRWMEKNEKQLIDIRNI